LGFLFFFSSDDVRLYLVVLDLAMLMVHCVGHSTLWVESAAFQWYGRSAQKKSKCWN